MFSVVLAGAGRLPGVRGAPVMEGGGFGVLILLLWGTLCDGNGGGGPGPECTIIMGRRGPLVAVVGATAGRRSTEWVRVRPGGATGTTGTNTSVGASIGFRDFPVLELVSLC